MNTTDKTPAQEALDWYKAQDIDVNEGNFMHDETIRKALEAHVSQPKDSAVMRDLAEALEEIREIYAGSEGFVAQTAPEAYQKRLLQKMCDRACKAVANNSEAIKAAKEGKA